MKNFKVGIAQFSTGDDKLKNIEKMKTFVSKLADEGADVVVLPEMWNCPYQNSFFPKFAEDEEEQSYLAMKEIAEEKKIYLIGGSIPIKHGDKIFNKSFVFDKSAREIYSYSKINLFDIEGFKESDTISAGKSLGVFETEFGYFGLAICYDLRFPEMFSQFKELGAKAVFVPSTFTLKTGSMHWELLTRARAVDCEYFIITSSIARDDELCKNAYGHSNIVSPFGDVLVDLEESENYVVKEIDLELVEKMRKKFPLDTTRKNRGL